MLPPPGICPVCRRTNDRIKCTALDAGATTYIIRGSYDFLEKSIFCTVAQKAAVLFISTHFQPMTKIDKKAIIDAAANIADEKGIANVTLKVLATELGIKSPSLYKHFNGGLDELNRN